jgi:hypothetical protein
VREQVAVTASGATYLEISGHPLLPGHSYAVFLSHIGRLAIQQIRVSLECEERATYHQGTDIRVERNCVQNIEVFQQSELTLPEERPFEVEFPVTIPADAPHSFRAAHNEIAWTLLVRLTGPEASPLERRYPVIVYPSNSVPSE